MNNILNPQKQVNYLQQCLSNDKRPLGLFLGAGCPVSVKNDGMPLIPDIKGLTKFIHEKLSLENNGEKDYVELLQKVDDNLIKDGKTEPTVEDILTHIRALLSVVGNDTVRGLNTEELTSLDHIICQLIRDAVDKELPSNKTAYNNISSWIGSIPRANPVEIFTTNYDLLMEQALERQRVPFFDGFIGSRKSFFDVNAMDEDKLPSRWARLWKLHGSINWFQTENNVFRGATDEDCLARVIHPSHLKYLESRRLPYLAMIDRLRFFLKQDFAVLIIIGYSFGDEHINEIIMQALESNSTATAFALFRGETTRYHKATNLAIKRTNLSILTRTGAIIGSNEYQWHERSTEAPSDSSDRWIQWKESGQNTVKAELEIGDFSVFGEFLHDIVGSSRPMPEVPNVQ